MIEVGPQEDIAMRMAGVASLYSLRLDELHQREIDACDVCQGRTDRRVCEKHHTRDGLTFTQRYQSRKGSR